MNTEIKTRVRKKELKKLNELDKQILLFFIERKRHKVTLAEVIDGLNLNDFRIIELFDSLTRLNRYRIIFVRALTIELHDIVALLQFYLQLERYNTALLLYAMLRKLLLIKKRAPEKNSIIFSYDDVIFPYWEDDYAQQLRLLCSRNKRIIHNAFHELVKRGYITSKHKYVYIFTANLLPEGIYEFIRPKTS
ncbi:MAG: hypothetical protein QW776_00600 [Candidatus Nitrosocaldus sp.]